MTKTVWHIACGGIHSPPRNNGWGKCDCGNVKFRWRETPGQISIAVSNPGVRDEVRVIGMHNWYLSRSLEDKCDYLYDHDEKGERTGFKKDSNGKAITTRREIHEDVVNNQSKGYLFESYGCPVVVIAVGESNDTFWESELPEDKRLPL